MTSAVLDNLTKPASSHLAVPKVAIICDFVEEGWASMDLVAEMLGQELADVGSGIQATRLCPRMRRRFSSHSNGQAQFLFNSDRLINRFWDYPVWLKKRTTDFDLFHVVDHSYSQLVHVLPAEKTVVTCHDVDTFRSVLDPANERRSLLFRRFTGRILRGFRKAARIVCPSAATKNEILSYGLAPAERISVVMNGVDDSCSDKPDIEADAQASRLLGNRRTADILHVGTTINRKRIDDLLNIVAAVRNEMPDLRLIRVGGALTPSQFALAKRLKIDDVIVSLPRINRQVLGAVYRRASMLVLPSEREGFGLPLAESMACGTPAVASDIEVFREVGGAAAEYCSVGDMPAWTSTVTRLLRERRTCPEKWQSRRDDCIRRASLFTWSEYARRMAAIYLDLLAVQP
jgi:glycosyltransferase involved in cell wall biosynthesis